MIELFQRATAWLMNHVRVNHVQKRVGPAADRSAGICQDTLAHANELLFAATNRGAITESSQDHSTGCPNGSQFIPNRTLFGRILVSIEVATGLLEIGLNGPLHIREERLSSRKDACCLTYVSDIHLRRNRSANLCRQVLESARHSPPHAVLLGGDLVDGLSELGQLRDLVGALCEMAPVLAVGGNHDCHVGLDRVRDAVISGGGKWIHDGATHLKHGSRLIAVAGPEAATMPEGDYRILCAHNPRIWKTPRRHDYHLVLAGHLHGCQLVAFEYRDRLFPGAVFYPYCYLSHQSGSTRLVVSRGVSDLVPIRWQCPREVVLCYV